MAQRNFAQALDLVLKHEGGFVNHPADPGGATNRGVTQRVYDAFRRSEGTDARSVRQINNVEVRAIYRAQYWDAVWADRLPAGLDYVVFDGAVNSGPSQSVKWLQRALNDEAKTRPKQLPSQLGAMPSGSMSMTNSRRSRSASASSRRSSRSWPSCRRWSGRNNNHNQVQMARVHNWREVLRYAWSIKLNVAAAVLGAIEFVLPMFFDSPPFERGLFAALAAAVSLGATLARIFAQPELSGKPNEE